MPRSCYVVEISKLTRFDLLELYVGVGGEGGTMVELTALLLTSGPLRLLLLVIFTTVDSDIWFELPKINTIVCRSHDCQLKKLDKRCPISFFLYSHLVICIISPLNVRGAVLIIKAIQYPRIVNFRLQRNKMDIVNLHGLWCLC